MIHAFLKWVWMKVPSNCYWTSEKASLCNRDGLSAWITPLKPLACASCFWPVNRWLASALSRVTERRTSEDWAYFIRELADVHYPDAEKIVLVMDHLSTHTPSALYQTFPPDEARRIRRKLEIHYTPVHGSWLNMAEIELSALARQCLSRRIGAPGGVGA